MFTCSFLNIMQFLLLLESFLKLLGTLFIGDSGCGDVIPSLGIALVLVPNIHIWVLHVERWTLTPNILFFILSTKGISVGKNGLKDDCSPFLALDPHNFWGLCLLICLLYSSLLYDIERLFWLLSASKWYIESPNFGVASLVQILG